MNTEQNAGPALTLTVFAGLCTGIGSAIAYFIRKLGEFDSRRGSEGLSNFISKSYNEENIPGTNES
jgi:hypothetical protein